MEARTTPFTRMQALKAAYQADRDMLDAIDRGSVAGDRVLRSLLRAIGNQPARVHVELDRVPQPH